MEFPELGSHCNEKSCKRLDFLPMLCDACGKTFCSEHLFFSRHNCSQAHMKDNKVPECPLCHRPVPVKPGESADVKIGRHIDDDCQSDPAREHRGKIYKNRCSFKNCKTRELVPFQCPSCRRNFCIKHRHETDHSCRKFQSGGRNMNNAGAAAMDRVKQHAHGGVSRPVQQSSNRGTDLRSAQNGLSDGDALAMAMRMSEQDSGSGKSATAQEAADAALAAQLYAQEVEERDARLRREQQQQQQQQSSRSGGRDGSNTGCHLS